MKAGRNADLVLAVMSALQEPGQSVSSAAIGDCTGWSHSTADHIAQKALKKIRRRLHVERADLRHLDGEEREK